MLNEPCCPAAALGATGEWRAADTAESQIRFPTARGPRAPEGEKMMSFYGSFTDIFYGFY